MDINRLANSGTLSIKKYVPGKSVKEAQEELGLDALVKLASNENALGSSPEAVRGISGLAEHIHIYPDAQSREIRSSLAAHLDISMEEITTGNGADGVIYNLGMAVIDQADEVIIPALTFPIYETITRVMRGSPVRTPMSGLRIDLDAIRRKITERTKAVFLCNPNNPTGDALPKDELRAFLESVPDYVLIVLDEAYVDFAEPQQRFDSLKLFRDGMANLFVLRTFSKTYGLAGLRFGYGVGQRDLIALINRIKPPFDVSITAQDAALHALADEKFYRSTVESCAEERKYFYSELEALGLDYVPSHTNFVLIDTGRNAQEVFRALLGGGFIVRAATQYGLPSHIRVTLGRHDQNERFFGAFKKVLGVLGAAPKRTS